MRYRLIILVSCLLLAACGQTTATAEGDATTTSTSTSEVEHTTTTQYAAAVTYSDASAETTSTQAAESTTTAAPETTTTAAPVTTTTAPSCPNVPLGQIDVTVSPDPFDGDGDGQPDILRTYRDNEANWHMQVLWSSGGGADVELEAFAQNPVRPLGGFDVNGDGRDEAFVIIGGGASSQIVALYSTWTDCILEPVLLQGTNTIYTMIIAFSIGQPGGVTCDAAGSIIERSASILDSEDYELTESSSDLFEATMSPGAFNDLSVVTGEEAFEYASLNCGNLST